MITLLLLGLSGLIYFSGDCVIYSWHLAHFYLYLPGYYVRHLPFYSGDSHVMVRRAITSLPPLTIDFPRLGRRFDLPLIMPCARPRLHDFISAMHRSFCQFQFRKSLSRDCNACPTLGANFA